MHLGNLQQGQPFPPTSNLSLPAKFTPDSAFDHNLLSPPPSVAFSCRRRATSAAAFAFASRPRYHPINERYCLAAAAAAATEGCGQCRQRDEGLHRSNSGREFVYQLWVPVPPLSMLSHALSAQAISADDFAATSPSANVLPPSAVVHFFDGLFFLAQRNCRWQNLTGSDGTCARAFALGAHCFTTPAPIQFHPANTAAAPSLFVAARASDEAMKELTGKSSLQAVVDAAFAASAAHHAAAKGLCA